MAVSNTEGEDEIVGVKMYINGVHITEHRGSLYLYRDRLGPIGEPEKERPVLRIDPQAVSMVRSESTAWLQDPEAAELLRTVLGRERDFLAGHRRERMAMWEKLYLKFIEDDPDVSPHHAAHRANECLEYWEAKRKKMRLTHLEEEEKA